MQPNLHWLQLFQQQPITLQPQSLLNHAPIPQRLSPQNLADSRKILRSLPKSLLSNANHARRLTLNLLKILSPLSNFQAGGPSLPSPTSGFATQASIQRLDHPSILLSLSDRQDLDAPHPFGSSPSSPYQRLLSLLNHTKSPTGILIGPRLLRLVANLHEQEPAHLSIELEQLTSQPGALEALAGLLNLSSIPHESQSSFHHLILSASSPIDHQSLIQQSRQAVELLLHSFNQHCDNSPSPSIQSLAQSTSNSDLFEALLSVILRLLFLAFAEQRRLLPLDNPIYRRHYSLQSILSPLLRSNTPSPDSSSAWQSFLANSNLIHSGSQHLQLNLTPFGSPLFNSQRFPFLNAWPLPNHIFFPVLRLLLLNPKHQLSDFSKLGVDTLGTIYEALLDRHIDGPPAQRALNPSPQRQLSGTFYTPPALARELASLALQKRARNPDGSPLSPREILSLRILDPACGSGSLLVELTKQLSEILVESWRLRASKLGNAFTPSLPYAEPLQSLDSQSPLPLESPQKLLHIARRLISERCISGVDLNPLAIDITRLSLWILSFDSSRPFSFIDHSIRRGDSLLGADIQQLRRFSLHSKSRELNLINLSLQQHIQQTLELRHALSHASLQNLPRHSRQQLLDQSNQSISSAIKSADWLIASTLNNTPASDATHQLLRALAQDSLDDIQQLSQLTLQNNPPLHWPLAFPEALLNSNPGFDIIISNPPFLGGKRLRQALGPALQRTLFSYLKSPESKSPDLAQLFINRSLQLLAHNGVFALITTHSVLQQHINTGLHQSLQSHQASISTPRLNFPWPGTANLNVSIAIMERSQSHSQSTRQPPRPKPLPQNSGLAYQGSIPGSKAFVIPPALALQWMKQNPANQRVLFPYLTGKDLHQSIGTIPPRWLIDLADRNLDQCQDFPEILNHISQHQCRLNQSSANRRRPWWRLSEHRPGLYNAIRDQQTVLLRCRLSHLNIIAPYPTQNRFSDGLIVFTSDDLALFAILQSSIHDAWVRHWSSTLRNTLRYSIDNALLSFPFPSLTKSQSQSLRAISKDILHLRKSLKIPLHPLYKSLHNPNEKSPKINKLRELHQSLDETTAAIYQLPPPSLHFQQEPDGTRLALPNPYTQQLIEQLTSLNQQLAENPHSCVKRPSKNLISVTAPTHA